MVKKIFKYKIDLNDEFSLNLPFNSDVLTIQVQKCIPYIWVMFDTTQPLVERKFRLAGTGHKIEFDENLVKYNYINSFQIENETLIFHLFEIININN